MGINIKPWSGAYEATGTCHTAEGVEVTATLQGPTREAVLVVWNRLTEALTGQRWDDALTVSVAPIDKGE